MTPEVMNSIYLIHNALLKEEGQNKIAFTTVHCSRCTYVNECLKKKKKLQWSAQCSPIIIRNSSNPKPKNMDVRPFDRTTDRTRCYIQHARPTSPRALSQPLRNGRAREKVMSRCDCVSNLDTPLVCARKHRQMKMKCAYSSVELQCSLPRAHGQALHEGFPWASRCEAA